MKETRKAWLLITVLLATAGCAESKPQKTKPAASAATTSSTRFEGIGSVSLHQGQPCTPQIMFDFHPGFGEVVELAAGFKDSRILTDAVRRHTRVRIAGNWRRGRNGACRFIDVASVQK